MAFCKPQEDNLPGDVSATNQTRNGTLKKSSNMTATTSNARSSELESARKMSMDQTTISTADEKGNTDVSIVMGRVNLIKHSFDILFTKFLSCFRT